ncbi:hypothetical protein AB5J72_35265 [Streptomyces sp. CG1]|uniref:hypothetical protein n=1 Tax=Streptomyces sp. CG1 TaxID=1287523 RepID=UPI0034E2922F
MFSSLSICWWTTTKTSTHAAYQGAVVNAMSIGSAPARYVPMVGMNWNAINMLIKSPVSWWNAAQLPSWNATTSASASTMARGRQRGGRSSGTTVSTAWGRGRGRSVSCP